jgi:hypothetical protein
MRGLLALDAEAGNADARELLDQNTAQLASARDRVATLRAAHAAALGQEAEGERAARASLQRTQLRVVKSCLAERDDAALALSIAITNAATAWRRLLAASKRAQAANPIGGSWPDGSLCELGELRPLVEQELARVGTNPELGAQDHLPGARCPIDYVQRPDKLPPLVEQVKAASAHVVAKLSERIPGKDE